MVKALSPLFQLSLCTIGCLYATTLKAQVTSDGTVNTQVNQNGNVAEITGGETRGGNLFHSFQDFSVPTDNQAFFNNAESIANIFSRVTGGNVSNIDGLIRANGSASLFLINPAGIIFGEGAQLELGGSFYGSSASSILFPDEIDFSATDTQAQPVLTINAPVGLSFRDNPAPIKLQNTNLTVPAGQTLTLLGGNINVTASELTAKNGQIFISGLAEEGTISLDSNLRVNIADEVDLAEVLFIDRTFVGVSGNGSGEILIKGNDITLANNSVINGGIDPEQSTVDLTSGNIQLVAKEAIFLEDNSVIRNNVTTGSTGNAGNIQLSAANMFLDESRISSTIQGEGNTGGVVVEVSDNLSLTGSEINSRIVETGMGNAGNLKITAGSLALNNSAIFSQTLGNGDAGGLSLEVTNTISAINDSFFQSQVSPGAIGNSNDVVINTGSLTLDSAQILANSNSIGNAGDVVINAGGDVSLDNDTIIISKVSQGEGDAGDITINSTRLLLDGRSFLISNTGDVNSTLSNIGNAGNITVNSSIVELNNFSQITSNSLSNAIGNAGDVDVNTDTLTIAGGSNINALTENGSDGGTVEIDARLIEISTGGKIVTGTDGAGNGGSIVLTVTENIKIDGDNPPIQNEPFIEEILQNLEPKTGLFANATLDATGDGGSIQIDNPTEVKVFDGGTISAASEGTGNGGSVLLQADKLTLDNQGIVKASTNNGSGGNIELQIAELFFMQNDNNLISAQALNNANGGNLAIATDSIIAFPEGNNDIIASAEQGQGGNITIDAESLLGIEERPLDPNTNDINASSQVSGLDGTVDIRVLDINPIQGATELPTNIVVPEETVAQACRVNLKTAARSSLAVKGKGGITPNASSPLDAHNVYVNGEDTQADIPEALETARGKIQPARGVRVTEKGIMLTAYRTNNAGDRLPDIKSNCS